jgi:hypothetical protein
MSSNKEGWALAHSTLKIMMNEIATYASVIKTKMRLDINNDEHIRNFNCYWKHFTSIAKFVLDYEEPKIINCAQLLQQNQEILQSIDLVSDRVLQLTVNSLYIMDIVRFEFDKCHKHFLKYIMSIEKFMVSENTQIFEDIIVYIMSSLKPCDFGWLLRSLKTEKEKQKWLTQVANIPKLIQLFVIFPAIKKYKKKYLGAFNGVLCC